MIFSNNSIVKKITQQSDTQIDDNVNAKKYITIKNDNKRKNKCI